MTGRYVAAAAAVVCGVLLGLLLASAMDADDMDLRPGLRPTTTEPAP